MLAYVSSEDIAFLGRKKVAFLLHQFKVPAIRAQENLVCCFAAFVVSQLGRCVEAELSLRRGVAARVM